MNAIYRLREVREQDGDQLWRWRNSERIRAVMTSDRPISREEHERWFTALLTREERYFYIFEKMGKPLGVMQYTAVNRDNGTCYWGFYLGERHLSRGTGTYLAYLGLVRAFDSEGFRKVCAEVLAGNAASYRLHKKMGFHMEGCLRKQVKRGHGYADVLLLALFREEWNQWKGNIDSGGL